MIPGAVVLGVMALLVFFFLRKTLSTPMGPVEPGEPTMRAIQPRVIQPGDRFGSPSWYAIGEGMPKDWRDAEGWEAWHRALVGQWDNMRAPLEALLDTVEQKRAAGARTAWMPGCGRSPLGRIVAHLGMEVVVSDVSPSAIRHQSEAALDLSRLGPPAGTGSFEAHVHDFFAESGKSGAWSPPADASELAVAKQSERATRPASAAERRGNPPDSLPFSAADAFDWVLNEAAIQGFEGEDLLRVARIHAAAVRPGGEAWFLTQNVQNKRRDALERALEAAGFVVPYADLFRRYRAALRAVDPDFFEILDHPQGRNRDKLRAVLESFKPLFEAAGDAEVARMQGARVAHVIYSTG